MSRSPAVQLRDLLAVAAVSIEVPDWFQPKMPPLPPLPKLPKIDLPYTFWDDPKLNVSSIVECSMNRYLKKLADGEVPNALDVDYPTLQKQFRMPVEAIDAVYGAFYDSVRPYREALAARDANYEREKLAQWPWAYADLVYERRTL